ncbi:MAG: GDP-mannose pyrophosphatase NudK [Alphaproteobacteria bacterium MarineAlpha2_Bin1]|nr:MAG: GDP-mannose pyrophosphatase NudK [Alphaproteobacteria bacterium MarineAlpha2_Bin1]
MTEKVKIFKKNILYNDLFKLEKFSLSFLKFNGKYSKPISRVRWVVGKACAAIVYDSSSDEIILINQFRLPTMNSEHDSGWLTEIVAGLCDKNESEEESIEREMLEEIGYKPERLIKICDVHMAPGSVKENLSIFFAEVSDKTRLSEGGGVGEEEDIKILRFKFEEINNLFLDKKILDAKTFIAIQWLIMNKDKFLKKTN